MDLEVIILSEVVEVLVTQSCPTLCDPVDCRPAGSSVHRIFQARILEWVAIPFSWVFFPTQGTNWISCIAGRIFTVWATRGKKRQISYDITYMWNPKKWYKWTYLQNRKRPTDTENKHSYQKGKGSRKDKIYRLLYTK